MHYQLKLNFEWIFLGCTDAKFIDQTLDLNTLTEISTVQIVSWDFDWNTNFNYVYDLILLLNKIHILILTSPREMYSDRNMDSFPFTEMNILTLWINMTHHRMEDSIFTRNTSTQIVLNYFDKRTTQDQSMDLAAANETARWRLAAEGIHE